MLRTIPRHLNHLSANAVFRRWVDMVLLSGSAIVILLAFKISFVHLFNWGLTYTTHWSPSLLYSVIFFGSALGAFVLIRLGGLQTIFKPCIIVRYPPVWIIGILSTAVLCAIIFSSHNPQNVFLHYPAYSVGMMVFMICLGGLLSLFYTILNSYKRPSLRAPNHRNALKKKIPEDLPEDDVKLLTWILDENPIQHPEDDRFGHKTQAQKIASLLLQKIPSNIGIVGTFGSGKSSLINLIKYYLSKNNNSPFSGEIVPCKIGGWGQVSGTVAQKILALSIEEVKKHVDCLSIVTLPENYRQAIGATKAPVSAVIAALLHTTHDPIVQLTKLDDILSAAKLRLVIFLEDLDRNIGDEIIRDEIPALLDRLRSLDHVSFVLAIGTEREFSDILIRICDYVEGVA